MKSLFILGGLLSTLLLAFSAQAQNAGCMSDRAGRTVCPEPDSRCLQDRFGDVVCSTPGGGIEVDRYGDMACGPGYCARDARGDLFCSDSARGAAGVDRYGDALCTGQCVPARAQACVKPQPMRR